MWKFFVHYQELKKSNKERDALQEWRRAQVEQWEVFGRYPNKNSKEMLIVPEINKAAEKELKEYQKLIAIYPKWKDTKYLKLLYILSGKEEWKDKTNA